MKLGRRVSKLEREQSRRREGASAYAEFMAAAAGAEGTSGDDAGLRALLRAVDSAPDVHQMVARLLALAERGAALAARGALLSAGECEEGDLLAAELTARVRAAGGSVVFGFTPAPV